MNERDIFIEALQQPEEKRTAFLDQACGHDTRLRERVEALLKQEKGLNSFLEEPGFELAATRNSSSRQGDLGTFIGPYRLMEQIGKGGFGLVFVAEQREPVRRRVALKLIKPGMDSSEVIARFEAERQALALMDHPNIARVFDAGTTDSGRPFFVMELVRGTPITSFCDQNMLSPRERLELFIPICRAIQHAHQKGIIHRDIKPSNVLVTLHDGEPVPKVIDFGVAKALNQELTQRTVYTQFAQMLGTPLYMSPEQAEMSGLDIDTRSDIYSLGVLLYELLTGSTPFDRKQLAEAAFDELRRIIREEDPPKPSTKLSQSGDRLSGVAARRKTEPARLSKMMRGELDWIVMKALEKDRNRRYETANGFAADVQRYLSNEPVVACPPTTGYRLRKFARRNKTVIVTTAIVGVALLLGTIVSTSQMIRANKEATAAKKSEQKAKEQTARAVTSENDLRESREELRDQLYASNMSLASEAYAAGDLDRMIELIDQHKPVSPEMDQRGFEWYLWWRAGHLAEKWARNPSLWGFHDLAVSPNGKIVAATNAKTMTIHVYDSDSMSPLCTPLRIGFPDDRLCFSPDGRFLISADTHRSPVRIFDTKTWARSITLDSAPSAAMAFARERPLLATDGWGQIKLWDTTSWKLVDSLAAKGETSHLAIIPDGTKLARGVKLSLARGVKLSRWDRLADRIELWDLSQRKVIRTLTGQRVIDQIAFSPDGEQLGIGDLDGDVHIWTVAELFAAGGEPFPTQTFSASHPIQSLAFSPDSARLAVGTSNNNAVLVWDLASQDSQPLATIPAHAMKVNDVAFVRDANTLFSCGSDGYLKMWDLSQCRPYDTIDRVDSRSQIGYAVDDTLIYQDDEGTIRRWDGTTRESWATLDSKQKYSRIAISTDGSTLAGVTHDEEELLVWNLANGSKLHGTRLDGLKRHNASRGGVLGDVNFSRLIVSNDGRFVACLIPWRGSHGPVVVIETGSGKIIGDAHGLSSMDAWPAFSPSGQQIVTQGYLDSFSRLSHITADSLEQPLRIRGRLDRCAAFSPDGRTLAIGSNNHDIRLHDVANGELVQTLKGHTDEPQSLAFWPESNRLVSGSHDGTVRIWKRGRSKYRLASTLHGTPNSVKQVAVSPRGGSLAALIQDGTVRVWRKATLQAVAKNVDTQLIEAGGDLRLHPDKALRALDEALARAPNNLRALTLLGRVHDERGDWESAVAAWTTALDLAPGNHYFLESRAKANAQAWQWAKSLADWSQLVQLTNESNGEYLLGRGECYLHMGHRDAARADFVDALTRTTNVESIERIISLLGFAESLVPTGTQWCYVTDAAPPADWAASSFDDSEWQTGWAPFGSGQGRLPIRTEWGDRDIWLRHTFELDQETDAPLVLHLLANDDAEVFLNGVSAASAGNTVNYQQHTEYQNVYPVVECSRQVRLRPGKNVLAVHGQNLDWRSYLDVGLYLQAEQEDIEATLIAAIERAPNSAVLHTALAERYVEQGNWRQAAKYFHMSAELSPGRGVIWMWAALMYRYSGDMDSYHQLTADIVRRFGETNSVLRAGWLTKACLAAEPTEANLLGVVELADRALALDPRDHDLRAAQMAKALAEYRCGNDQAAIEWAQKCRALSVLALAHARTGEVELATKELAELTKSRQGKPFHTAIKRIEYAHEWAFAQILFEEVQRKLAPK